MSFAKHEVLKLVGVIHKKFNLLDPNYFYSNAIYLRFILLKIQSI